MMGDVDKASEIVAHVCNIFTEVPIEHIYSLIPSICSIETDDVDTATQKICNFLIENGDMFDIPDLVSISKIVKPSNDIHSTPRSVIELVNSDSSDNDGEELNLMDLAHQLAGTTPNVPEAITFIKAEKDKTLEKLENIKTIDEFDDQNPNELKKLSDTVILSDVGDVVHDVQINVNAQEEVQSGDSNIDIKNSSTNIQHPAKRRKKESTIVQGEEDITNIAKNVENITTKPHTVPECIDDDCGPLQDADSSFNEPPIVSSIPNLDCTLTDVDVLFECGCCFNENPFDYMVQCLDGHLFCCQCLERYAQESVYGHGKGELLCMTAGCSEIFPNSQLFRALPFSLYKKYEERVSDECLNSACLENFVRCKFCGYGAELEPEQQFFTCTQCQKRFCRKCEELFKDHEGLKCEEVEKDVETKIRTDYEEKMAEAKIRTCGKCKSRFTKESGCNKITCRCSQTMCYICRTEKIDYTHFCQHPRSPNKGCKKCKACFLWSNADEDDKLAIEEIKKEALKMREKEGYQMPRQIGAPNEPEPGRPIRTNVAQRARRPRVANRARARANLDYLVEDLNLINMREALAAAEQARAQLPRQLIQPARLLPPMPALMEGNIPNHPPVIGMPALPPPPILLRRPIAENLFPPPQIDMAPPAAQRAPTAAKANYGTQAQVPEVAAAIQPKHGVPARKVAASRTREQILLEAGIPLIPRFAKPPPRKRGKAVATTTQELLEINISRTTSPVKINNTNATNIINDPRLSRNGISTNGMIVEASNSGTSKKDTKTQILEQVRMIEDSLEYKNFDQIKLSLNMLKNIANDL